MDGPVIGIPELNLTSTIGGFRRKSQTDAYNAASAEFSKPFKKFIRT
jgi:hypothetical protein